VPELTHDSAEDGFHEIQLSGKQVVFLIMAGIVLSSVVFFFGVAVGRGVLASRGGETPESEPISSNATPVAEAEAAPPSGEPPAPPADDELSYHKRLQGGAPAREELKPQSSDPPAAKPAASAPPAAVTEKAAPPPSAGPDVPQAGRPGVWVIQVHALQNRATAAALVQRLVAKGYPAFLSNPPAGSPEIYRVQIGRYADRREADQVARRLEKEEQFTPQIKR
jgi:DedD protein